MRLLYLLLTLSLFGGCSLLFDAGGTDGSVPMEIDADLPGAECDAPWSAWERRAPLSIGSTTEPLTSIPILVTISTEQQIALGLQGDGNDLRFSDDEGEQLDYEIDTWVGDVAQVWVKVPELRAGQATRVWMYGKNSQVSDAQDSAKVWNNGFRGVWHFSKDQLLVDSTGKLGEGAPDDAVSDFATNSAIGNSVFIETSPVVIPNSAALDTPDAVTLEARVWLPPSGAAAARNMLRRKDSVILTARRQGNTRPDFKVFLNQGGSAVAQGPADLSLNAWLYVAGTYDTESQTAVLYVDGEEVSHTQSLSTSPIVTNENPFGLGERLRGHMDEARLSGVARSAAWIDAQHRSMSGTFVTVGDVISCPD